MTGEALQKAQQEVNKQLSEDVCKFFFSRLRFLPLIKAKEAP